MTPNRGDLLADLATRMTRAGDSIPGAWTGFSVVAEITALGVRVTGFRYDGDEPGLPILMDTDAIEAIAGLRTASPGPDGQLFDIYVARLDRSSGGIVDQAFTAQSGSAYRVTARNVTGVAELVRPGAAYLHIAEPEPVVAAPQPPQSEQPASPSPEPQTDQPAPPSPEPQTDQSSPPDPSSEPGSPPQPDPVLAQLTVDIRQWPELADAEWTGYAAAVSFWPTALYTVGFAYRPDGATPTYVGGDFHQHLHELRAADAPVHGPPGAALLRMADRHGPVQVRLLYPPASDQIHWNAPDSELARRLAPPNATNTTVLVPPGPDLLDVGELVERIRSNVAASLRSRDGWRSFALALDVDGARNNSFIYTSTGIGEPYNLPLPVTAELAELAEQTARPDGTRWAGSLVHSWAGGDRVDLSFWGQAAINSFLADAATHQGLRMRPPPEPPATEPTLPWPSEGGYLDPGRLLVEVTDHVGRSPGLADADWDRVAIVVSFAGAAPDVRGLRYLGSSGPVAETALTDVGPVGKLRRSLAGPDGRRPTALVLSGHRGVARLDVRALFGAGADELVALPTGPLIDRVRPT